MDTFHAKQNVIGGRRITHRAILGPFQGCENPKSVTEGSNFGSRQGRVIILGQMSHTTYSVLMIDDEELIRRGFQVKVPWKDLGFEFWEPCIDGRQALSLLASRRPDVLITDINMPHVDGLELCRLVNSQYPDVLLVVLSGFDDFEYARTALRYRVWDYILKPLNVEDLKVFLVKLRLELDARRTASRAGAEALGLHLLRGAVPETLLSEGHRRLGEGFANAAWACSQLETTWRGDLATLAGRPGEEAPVVVGVEAPPHASFRRWKLLYHAPDEVAAKRIAHYSSRRLVRELRQQSEWAVASLASAVRGIAGLPVASHEAEEGLIARFVLEDEVYQAQPAEKAALGLEAFPQKFRAVVSGGTLEDLSLLIAHFQKVLGEARPVARRLTDELQAVFNAVADLHPSPEDVDDLRPVQIARDAEDLCRRLETLCRRVKQRLELESSPLADQKIREFQSLLARRFPEPQLGIDEMSSQLNLSPSYLTKLLRKKLGRSFLDCLTEARMNEARHLLASTNLMTYEIAEKTGFADARYFSSSFKKNNGYTPSEFRALRREKP